PSRGSGISRHPTFFGIKIEESNPTSARCFLGSKQARTIAGTNPLERCRFFGGKDDRDGRGRFLRPVAGPGRHERAALPRGWFRNGNLRFRHTGDPSTEV